MRILQLIDSLSIGGAERMSVNIANALAENGIESYLVASRKGGPLQQFLSPAVKYSTLDKKNGLDVAAFYRLIKLVKQIKPDIIHAHSTSVLWGTGVKIFAPNTKLIWHDHNGMQVFKNKSRSIYRYTSRFYEGVIVVNSNLLEWGKTNLKVKPGNVVYLKNFPSLKKKRKVFSLSKQPNLVCLANLRPVKDQVNIIIALDILAGKGYTATLKLAGGFTDTEYHKTITDAIAQHKMGEKVVLLGNVDDVATLLSNADIGIISSRSEGLPVALLEYGLAGLPVICTDTGQCSQVLGNGAYGILVRPQDSTALADAVIQMIENATSTEQLAHAFNKHVEEEYGAEKFLSGYLKLLKRIVNEK